MATTVEQVLKSKDIYGKKIYLLGTSILGPINTPIKANSLSHVISVFGTEGTLVDAYRIIVETNLDCEVYLVKVTGVHSEAYLNINQPNSSVMMNGFNIKAKHANEKYNDISIILDSDSLFIQYTSQTSDDDYILEYNYNEYLTMHDLSEAINNDTRNLKSDVYSYVNCEPGTPTIGALDSVNPIEIKLTGGDSGLYYNKNMLYNCLEYTYSILEGLDIDIIVPLNASYDDTFTDDIDDIDTYYDLNREYLTLKEDDKYVSYYTQLLSFCKKQMRFGFITHGVMGLNLIENPMFNEDKYIEVLEYMNEKNKQDSSNSKYKHLVSVIVGDLYGVYGTSLSNGYIAYAPLVASLSVTENTTNKKLPLTFSIGNIFSNDGIDKLRDLGFTTFRYSPLKKAVVVANGITTSEDEDFKFLCNVRMVQLTMCYVRTLLSSYIGESLSQLITSKQLEKSLKSLLENLVSINIISGYKVNDIINPVTGHIFLDLSLKTAYMIESIRTFSGLASKGD